MTMASADSQQALQFEERNGVQLCAQEDAVNPEMLTGVSTSINQPLFVAK